MVIKTWLKRLIIIGLFCGLIIFAGGTWYIHHETKNLPTITKQTLRSDASSNMYSANGHLIWSSAVNKRVYVKYKDLPKNYINLLLSTEDRTFFQDSALNGKGLLNAGISFLKSKFNLGAARGGSTLEQQLIKLSVFSTSAKDRNINRKIKEAFLAEQLDHNYTKKQILEMYVNKIYLGEGCYGAQTIAKTYWDKPLNKLNLSQLAIVVGIGQAGSYYNLYDRPNVTKIRRNQVLKAALANHKITKSQYNDALNTPIRQGLKKRYWQGKRLEPVEKRYASFINSTLMELTNAGYDLTKTPLQIHTSLDEKISNIVNTTFNKHPEFYQNKRQQAAITIANPKTGHIIAQNGGRFSHSIVGLNRATMKNRSTGSAIKPINEYGPALQYLGWNTDYMLNSGPYHYAGTNVTATNFGGASYGMVTMRRAIVESLNTPAIRTLDAVGPLRAKTFAGKLGITQKAPIAGSYALGMNASTEQMAMAYASFANGGVYKHPEYINYLIFPDFSRKNLNNKGHRAMSKATAYVMTNMLKDVINDSDGTLHAGKVLGIHMAAKTGTVAYPYGAHVPDDSAMDFWTCGYTKSLSIALWEGYDNPMKKNSFLWDMNSIKLRGRLWRYLVKHITKGRDNSDWSRPKGVAGYGTNLSVVHTTHIKTLHNLAPAQIQPSVNDVMHVKHVVKNKQKQYTVPKHYTIGQWEVKFNKAKKKAEKEDNRLYKKVPSQEY